MIDYLIRQRNYLLDVSRTLTSELSLSEVLRRILRSATEMLGGQAGIIALAENNHDLAVSELSQGNMQNPYNLFRLAQAYTGSGDTVKAREMCEKAAYFNATNSFALALIRADAIRMLSEM